MLEDCSNPTEGKLQKPDPTKTCTVIWENHYQNIMSSLRDLTCSGLLTGITLKTKNHTMLVHNAVLSTFSPFIEECLKAEQLKCYVIIKEVEASILQSVVDYMYTGFLLVPQADLLSMYEVADLLKLNIFQESIVQFSSEQTVHFALREPRQLLLRAWTQRASRIQCNVTLVSNNFQQSYCHSYVLGACSSYLLNVFNQHFKNKDRPYIFVLQNVEREDVETVLEFCYRGSVLIRKDRIQSVYDSANLLGVQSLCKLLLNLDPTIKINDDCETVADFITTIQSSSVQYPEQVKPLHFHHVLPRLFECESLVDVCFLKGKTTIKAHSTILSLFSPYFRNLCKNVNEMKGAVVLVKDLSSQHLYAFFDYIYKGETNFPGNADDFYKAMVSWIDFNLLPVSKSNSYFVVAGRSELDRQEKEENGCAPNESFENYDYRESSSTNVAPIQNDPEPTPDISHLHDDATNHSENLIFEDDTKDMHVSPADYTVNLLDKLVNNNEENKFKFPEKGHSRRTYTCTTCRQQFASLRHFREHLAIHPDGRVARCDHCQKTFTKPSQLRLHLRTHTGSRPYQCRLCGQAFAARSALNKHGDIHRKDKVHKFVCGLCNKTFSRKEYLGEHLRAHSGSKPFECKICHKKFVGKTGLNHHVKIHSEDSEKKDSVCEICGKNFTRHALWTHMKTHSKDFKCNLCTKKFATPAALRIHVMGTHLGHKNHHCETCGKGFMQKNHLIRHLKVHQSDAQDGGTAELGDSAHNSPNYRIDPQEENLHPSSENTKFDDISHSTLPITTVTSESDGLPCALYTIQVCSENFGPEPVEMDSQQKISAQKYSSGVLPNFEPDPVEIDSQQKISKQSYSSDPVLSDVIPRQNITGCIDSHGLLSRKDNTVAPKEMRICRPYSINIDGNLCCNNALVSEESALLSQPLIAVQEKDWTCSEFNQE